MLRYGTVGLSELLGRNMVQEPLTELESKLLFESINYWVSKENAPTEPAAT